jgi:hypothetical protein
MQRKHHEPGKNREELCTVTDKKHDTAEESKKKKDKLKLPCTIHGVKRNRIAVPCVLKQHG